MLLYGYQEGGVLLCQTGQLHPTIPCQGHVMSGDRSHRRGGERLPLLPCCLGNSLTGLPPRSPWGTDGPLHLLMGNVPLATLPNIPPRYSPLNTNLPYQSLTLLPLWHPGSCPDPNGNTLPLTGLYPCLDWKVLLEGSLKNHPP